MAIIYGPQNFTTPWSDPDANYKSNLATGPDAPIAAYPEFINIWGLKVHSGGGPSGENVMDLDPAVPAWDYSGAGAAMLKLGPEASGMWDSTSGITVSWKQFFSSVALNQCFLGQVLVIVGKVVDIGVNPDPEVGLFTGDSVIWLGFEQTAGSNFFYELYYAKDDGTFSTFDKVSNGTGGWLISGDTCDNAWHDMEIQYKPGTAGGITPTWSPRASDGYLRIVKDGVTIFEHASLALYIPTNSTYGPEPNRLYGVWHGYASMIGKFTGLTIATAVGATATDPETSVEENSSVICQGDTVEPGKSATGEILPLYDPNWTAVCGSGGEVPSAADLTDAEDWDQ